MGQQGLTCHEAVSSQLTSEGKLWKSSAPTGFSGVLEVHYGEIFSKDQWKYLERRMKILERTNLRISIVPSVFEDRLVFEAKRDSIAENLSRTDLADAILRLMLFSYNQAKALGADVERVTFNLDFDFTGTDFGDFSKGHTHTSRTLTIAASDHPNFKKYGTWYRSDGLSLPPDEKTNIKVTKPNHVLVIGDVWHGSPHEVARREIKRPFIFVDVDLL